MLFAGKFSSCSSRGAPLDNRQQARSQHVCHAQWLENKATVDVPVPLEACFKLWDDRERIPNWMPWIKSVKVLENDARLSRWTLSTNQFGRDWEFSWLARNLPPVKNTKIHWVSEPGTSMPGISIMNRGQIKFARNNPTSCAVTLVISYEVPDALAPFANLLTPVVEGILKTDMERFREVAIAAK
ncbi:MAG: hypothetical protein WDW36_006579 [Sanguina aurantia]